MRVARPHGNREAPRLQPTVVAENARRQDEELLIPDEPVVVEDPRDFVDLGPFRNQDFPRLDRLRNLRREKKEPAQEYHTHQEAENEGPAGALSALHRPNEVRAHIHAALNVGATRQEVAEVIFQMVTYGGMPVVVDALEVYGQVLAERGEPFPGEEPAR